MNTTGKTGNVIVLGRAPRNLLYTLGNVGRPMQSTIRTLIVTNSRVMVNSGHTPLTTPLIGSKAVKTQQVKIITT